jgi:23S rRNA (adenine2503-C2)-methyltransferase
VRAIFDLSFVELSEWCASVGAKPFVAGQIRRWIYEKRSLVPSEFTNLVPQIRAALADAFSFALPEVDQVTSSEDGSEKILLKLADGAMIESVLMPTRDRVALCLSSQVGCRLACAFCQTGKMGFGRNLTAGEILAQVLVAYRRLAERGDDRRITNIVFMGMGEPLDNYEQVLEASKTLLDENLFGVSKHRLTISTAGIPPAIRRLGAELPLRLAISLHAAADELRTQLMPINARYPLAELKEVLLDYPAGRDGITFEYILIKDLNCSILHARRLVKFLHGLKAKVNLIPMNPHPGVAFEAPSEKEIREFQSYLSERSIAAPVRYSKGKDVSGACGQLAAKRREEIADKPMRLSKRRHGGSRLCED